MTTETDAAVTVEGKRLEYEMSQADLDGIIAKIKGAQSTPLIMLQCGMPTSPQEAANAAWGELGERMGFDAMTVEPIPGKGNRYFSAVAKAEDITHDS